MDARTRRYRRMISFILSAVTVLTLNVPVTATERYYDEAVPEEEETLLDIDSLDEADENNTEAAIDEADFTSDSDGGWTCEISDNQIATNKFTNTASGCRSEISLYNTTYREEDKYKTHFDYSRELEERLCYNAGKPVGIKYHGKLTSNELIIDTSGDTYLRNGSITISVSKGDLSNYNDKPLIIRRCYKKIKIGEVVSENKTVPVYRMSGVGCYIHFELEDGLKLQTVRDYNNYLVRYEIYMELDDNRLYNYTEVSGTNYSIKYYSKVPYVKGPKAENEYYCEEMYVIDNETRREYKVEKIKVIKLKKSPGNQGPFPTVSNAAIQIKKLTGNVRKVKDVEKVIKKATKVKKNQSVDEVLLPLIIYPVRLKPIEQKVVSSLDEEKAVDDIRYPTLRGKKSGKKNNYKFTFGSFLSKKITIKNGKKDSFKTGVQSVDYDKDKKTLYINSAEAWAGYAGLSDNSFSDKSK